MRLIISYSRDGAAKYVSHLDMQRLFMRACRRSKLDAVYTKGFNPHIIMSFASPLSVGYATLADYLEIEVADGTDAQNAKAALNAALPADVRINGAFFINERAPKLMAMNHSARYRLNVRFKSPGVYDRIKSELDEMLAGAPRAVADRKGRQTDVSRLLLAYETDGNDIICTLSNNSRESLNPAVLVSALGMAAGEEIKAGICRLECYASAGGQILPFREIGRVYAPL